VIHNYSKYLELFRWSLASLVIFWVLIAGLAYFNETLLWGQEKDGAGA